MKTTAAALLLAASLACMATPAHAPIDFTRASYSYRVDDPPPTDPPSEEAPVPAPAECICGGLPGARYNCRKQCERDGLIVHG